MEATMRAVILFLFLVVKPAYGYTTTNIQPVVEPYRGFFINFLTGIPVPRGVYQVVFSNINSQTLECDVALRAMPGETATLYSNVVNFATDDPDDRVIIFPPNSERPYSLIEFVLEYECDVGYDDMSIPTAK